MWDVVAKLTVSTCVYSYSLMIALSCKVHDCTHICFYLAAQLVLVVDSWEVFEQHCDQQLLGDILRDQNILSCHRHLEVKYRLMITAHSYELQQKQHKSPGDFVLEWWELTLYSRRHFLFHWIKHWVVLWGIIVLWDGWGWLYIII